MMATGSKINDPEFLVPEGKILAVKQNEFTSLDPRTVLQPLRGEKQRDWLSAHSYYCLPLLIGNQYGFVLRSLHNFTVIWNGGAEPGDTCVQVEPDENSGHQHVGSHFGNGIVTIQNWFHLRTPPGVNLMTIAPPNFIMPAVTHLTAVVETDNLQRDFTFNFKVNMPHFQVVVKKGDPIGAFIPVPRYYVDGFDVEPAEDHFSTELIQADREETRALSIERSTTDQLLPHQAGRRYYRGENSQGCPFGDHQRTVKNTNGH